MGNQSNSKFECAIDDIPAEYVLTLGKQKFIRFAGLQFLMDRIGAYKVQTACIRDSDTEVLYEAKVWVIPSEDYLASKGLTSDSPFLSLLLEPIVMHATVNTSNTSANLLNFRDCLAETRAIARAFRIATGCPYTAVDELDRSDLKNMAQNGDITIQTIEEMMGEESAPAPAAAPIPVGFRNRSDMIIHINNARKRNKGVDEFLKSYLDEHNVAIIENLSLADIVEVHKKVIALENGE